MKNSIFKDIKFLSIPLIKLTVMLFVTVITLSLGLNKINQTRAKLNEIKLENTKLNQKLSILNSISEVLSSDMNFLNLALPVKSSALYGISQLKNLASQNNLSITNIKSSNPTSLEGDIFKTTISFDIAGSEIDTFSFFEILTKVLPIMNYTKVKFTIHDNILETNLAVEVYSSSLPKLIPSVTTVANDLTKSEIDLFEELKTYKMPEFTTPTVQEFPAKESPFK